MKRLLIALVAVGAAVTAADSPALADAPQNSHNCGGLGELNPPGVSGGSIS